MACTLHPCTTEPRRQFTPVLLVGRCADIIQHCDRGSGRCWVTGVWWLDCMEANRQHSTHFMPCHAPVGARLVQLKTAGRLARLRCLLPELKEVRTQRSASCPWTQTRMHPADMARRGAPPRPTLSHTHVCASNVWPPRGHGKATLSALFPGLSDKRQRYPAKAVLCSRLNLVAWPHTVRP